MTTKTQYAPTFVRPKNHVRASRSIYTPVGHASLSVGHDVVPGRSSKMDGPSIDLVRDIPSLSYNSPSRKAVDDGRTAFPDTITPKKNYQFHDINKEGPYHRKVENEHVLSNNTTPTELSLPDVHKRQSSFSSPHSESANNNSPTNYASPSPRTGPQSKAIMPNRIRVREGSATRLQTISDNENSNGRVEIGLENLGNTCFMNSALQCLLHIPPLVSYFLEQSRVDRDLNTTSSKKGMLATSFNHLIREVVSRRNGTAIAPVNFQRAVAVFAPYLLDFQQQDSQEFLRFLLDGMSEDLCRKRPPVLAIENGGTGEKMIPAARSSSAQILPMLPGIALTNTTSPSNGNSSSNNNNAAGSVQRLRLETRAMQQESQPQATDNTKTNGEEQTQPSMNQTEEEATTPPPSNSNNNTSTTPAAATAAVPVSTTKLRITRDIVNARNNTTDEQQQSANSEIDEDTINSNRIESAPQSARSSYAPSFSRSIRDVMSGKSLRLGRRDRPRSNNSVGSNSANNNAEEGNGSIKASADDNSINRNSNGNNQLEDTQSNNKNGGTTPTAFSIEKEASIAWERYLKLNDSIITDIFAGLLQSTVQCLTCQHRSYAFDPFLDLSVPIFRDGEVERSSKGGLFGSIRQQAAQYTNTSNNDGNSLNNKSTLEKCLEKFTAEEVLDGDNMYHCEKCRKNRKCIKQLSIYRYPKVLVVHIKRFRFNNTLREKLSTDVHFPLSGLDLSSYLSNDRLKGYNGSRLTPPVPVSNNEAELDEGKATGSTHIGSSNNNEHIVIGTGNNPITGTEPPPVYDLIGVSNHSGSLNGGHYIAHVDTDYARSKGQSPRWMCFNDARVSYAQASSIAGPTAYVLFYKLREDDTPGGHGHNDNSAGSGMLPELSQTI